MPSAQLSALTADDLVVGEESMPRELSTNNVTTVSGALRMCLWTARKTEEVTQVRMFTTGTAAAATPTLVRIALAEVAADGTITLVAATDSDTTLFSSTNTAYTKSFSAPYRKVAGRRYGVGALVVTGAATPVFAGNASAMISTENGQAPAIGWVFTGLTDLPAIGANFASGAASGTRPYAAVVP